MPFAGLCHNRYHIFITVVVESIPERGISSTSSEAELQLGLLIPMKVVNDSDLISVSDSEAMPFAIGAKRRWHGLNTDGIIGRHTY
jgi:hypothetical protein